MTNSSIKVSIVIPVYNQEKYLDISLASIVSQTYSNLEIVIVNDGSDDNSSSIIDSYRNTDARIKVINQPNRGLVDATITGLKNLTGDYVAFLDPDDRVDEDFIENFVSQLTEKFDIIAMGYYLNNLGTLSPKYLKESKIYFGKSLNQLRENFLYEGEVSVSNRLFISRWNKLYRTETVKKFLPKFERCSHISLGEDSLFTVLALQSSDSVKVNRFPNSYFYNIANQNSMMNSGEIKRSIRKSKMAYEMMLNISSTNQKQAMALYFFLIENLFQKTKKSDRNSFIELYKILRKDRLYQDSLDFILKHTTNKLKKSELILRKYIGVYGHLFVSFGLIQTKKVAKLIIKEIPKYFIDIRKSGITKAKKLAYYRKSRKTAFIDLRENLPVIESQIEPILSKYLSEITDFSKAPICQNIFVFWWDGFENAPRIVKKCLDSIIRYNPSRNVIKISEENFRDYTNINQKIIDEFYKGNISVQTFSDILRFNLLMNNGGAWIDATILFLGEFDLFKGLEDKSFNSLNFSSSASFLQYKNETCSWSGYFIASRKNAYFVTVMNSLFEEYFLTYGNYPIYFFIDVLFILCKINKIDDDVLSKTDSVFGDMFLLPKLYNEEYNDYCKRLLMKVPQKLSWSHNGNEILENSFFNKLEL